ncbi:MAG: hypothetical protein NTY23_12405 [Chloroflexi bacterium]|nr:hypothetical protein [Chloroflexota bacterium]
MSDRGSHEDNEAKLSCGTKMMVHLPETGALKGAFQSSVGVGAAGKEKRGIESRLDISDGTPILSIVKS